MKLLSPKHHKMITSNLCRNYLFSGLLTVISIPTVAVSEDTTPDISKSQTEANDSAVPAINVKDAEISSILKVFSRRLRRNYILDERVRGKVTMFLPGEVTAEDSQRILDTVLALKGFTTVPVGDNLWKVLPSREAKQSTVPTIPNDETTSPTNGAVVTKIVRLQHINANEVQPILSSLISADGLVTAYGGANSLILIDYATNIQRLTSLIRKLDIPFYDQDMTMIPVKHADAVDLAEKLKVLILEEEAEGQSGQFNMNRVGLRRSNSATATVPSPGMPAGTGGIVQASSGGIIGQKRAKAPKILADERTNSIIVVADDETTARIKALISELDSPLDKSTSRFFVYRCQHANAEELAEVLGGLTGAGMGGSGINSNTNLGNNSQSNFGNDTLNGRSSRNSRTNSRLNQTRRQPGQQRQDQQSGVTGSVQLSESLSITADPATNSLIINGSKADYEKIKELLASLDIKRRQVLVEAMILEVGIDASTAYGTDWLSSTGGADGGVLAQSNFGGASGLTGLLSDPRALTGFSIAAASSGSIRLPGNIVIPSQAVLLNAARSNQNVNVLSSPTLLATDNQQAEIVVGQNVPFLASTSTNDVNLNNTFNQIERQDVGITLRITPQISSNDFVTLQIFTDVSSVIDSANSTLGPTTTVRSSDTTVITKDNQMVVIGGLMSDESNDSDTGVPFFKQIPVFGTLFGRDTDRIRRTNLLTFITPRIIKDQFDARDITIDKRSQTAETINSHGHKPNRNEILNNERIDNVAEIVDSPEGEPGTITTAPISSDIISQSEEKKEVVKPEIPLSSRPTSDSGNFIVFKSNTLESGASLPFVLSDQMLFGIELPVGASVDIPNFFSSSDEYRFGTSNAGITASIIGKFASKEAANDAHGLSSSQWHRLSPIESINLGKGPWTKISR